MCKFFNNFFFVFFPQNLAMRSGFSVFFQPEATQPVRFASRFLLANRLLKFIIDPTPKRGPSNVQSVTEVFQLRQVVHKQTKKILLTAKLKTFFKIEL